MTMTHDLSGTILVLGGARSGKSTFAESLFEACGSAAYLATAEALDTEMTSAHRAPSVPAGQQMDHLGRTG